MNPDSRIDDSQVKKKAFGLLSGMSGLFKSFSEKREQRHEEPTLIRRVGRKESFYPDNPDNPDTPLLGRLFAASPADPFASSPPPLFTSKALSPGTTKGD